jgi:hypothetical protein
MGNALPIALAITVAATTACAKGVHKPAGVAPGTPYVSWIIMSGDRDNPDQEFVCQSEPRNDCVVPVSKPDSQVFSDVHVYYHGVGVETKYSGSIQIGIFQGATGSHNVQSNITVQKGESIANQSVSGIVTATPGRYAIVFQLVATASDTGRSQTISEQVPVVVK